MWDPWQDAQRIVDAVNDAPSVFNDRPWQFRVVADDRIEMHAVGAVGRGLVPVGALGEGADPATVPGSLLRANALAREEYISCGAALYNLRLAIRVAGHDLAVWLLPDPGKDPTLLASVEIMKGRISRIPPGAEELYEAMLLRRTSREPFRVLPVPMPVLVEMEGVAAAERGWLRVIHTRQARVLLRASADAAKVLLDPDPPDDDPVLFGRNMSEDRRQEIRRRLAQFQAARARVDAVPRQAKGPKPRERAFPGVRSRREPKFPPVSSAFSEPGRDLAFFEPASRFNWGWRQVQLMALSTDDDRPLDWLRAGQALQHALLTATRYSMSAAYGRTARYHATKDGGLPARRFLPLGRGTEARYGVAVSPLTQFLELEDIKGEPRRWPRKWYHRWPWWWYPEAPQMVLRVGYVPVEPSPAPRGRALPLLDKRVNPPREYEPTEVETARRTGEGFPL